MFSLGCGRIFEGTYEQMFSSLQLIKSFPENTKIYCGHEYTLKNAEFCIKHDKDNSALIEKIKSIKEKLDNGFPTIPTTIKEELDCNIFLRSKDVGSFSKLSFAVIKTGGKQYKVKAGEIIKVEKLLDSKAESKVEFKEVLAYGDDKAVELGEPTISGAKVEADLIKNSKNRTVLIFKKRRRKNSRRKNGHRQQYSLIRINKIFSKDGKVLSEAEKKVTPLKKTDVTSKIEKK